MAADGAIQRGDFDRWVKQRHDALAQAATAGVDAAATGLQADLRSQIAGAGLGIRLGNAIRKNTYPTGGRVSIAAASTVEARPGADEILSAFAEGATIRATNGKRYLAIPLPAAGKGRRGGRITPREFERRNGVKLRFVPGKRGGGFLVLDNARLNKRGLARPSRSRRATAQRDTITLFILVPLVRLGKRISPRDLYAKWQQQVPVLIERAIPRDL